MDEMQQKAMKLVASMDRKQDAEEVKPDEEDTGMVDEGLTMAATEMMDAFRNSDQDALVLALKNFISMSR